ncbi:STIV orfB116 family protein [Piscinibacter terrae]|uniref:DUF1874 domain-containing protein n=1 Tax=Piscinibacter terrae TaxID=2496871 RepID=A0A3N7JM77_9BURK|nr:DUF1874 domain-containing protein [Albitalea terrae]RQP22359.1 DUF1874 domain-containing protein [Albitalea terrae]
MRTLLGNTFPPAYVRRECNITMISLEQAREILEGGFASFWGHENTVRAVSDYLKMEVPYNRESVRLDDENFPSFDGKSHKEVVVISPTYKDPAFRPKVGVEVTPEEICSWHCQLWTFI